MEETSDLLKRLQDSNDLESLSQYIKEIERNKPLELNQYIKSVMQEKNIGTVELVKRSLIERTYFYQILNGRKRPGRDKLIAIAIALKLTLKEAQHLLVTAKEGILNETCKRDCIIIFALSHKLTVLDTNFLLTRYSEPELK